MAASPLQRVSPKDPFTYRGFTSAPTSYDRCQKNSNFGAFSKILFKGSEDETEVPSRGYLKRQAQLVVDAKSRRKNIRMQIRRN